MPVVDASVYVALFHPLEEAHEAAWAWLRKACTAGEPIAAPALLAAEVAAAISRGAADTTLAQRAVEQLLSRNVVELIPVTVSLASQAARIAAEHRIRGADACYVALAARLEQELVTLDRQQLERGATVVATRRPAG